jgi:hypothetical protein
MVKIWRDPRWVSYTPIATTCLLETANLGQIVRMWTYHTAAGQSLTSWCCVNVALWLWANLYRVITPDQKIARYTIKVGITLNTLVILRVWKIWILRWHRRGCERQSLIG